MTRIDSTKVKWRVQVRMSRAHKWVNKGLFETREDARWSAHLYRSFPAYDTAGWIGPLGFGNTRVVRHISGKGKA